MASITITIDNAQATEFFEKFVLYHPKPATWSGTDAEWVKEWIIDRLQSAYKQGRTKATDISGMLT